MFVHVNAKQPSRWPGDPLGDLWRSNLWGHTSARRKISLQAIPIDSQWKCTGMCRCKRVAWFGFAHLCQRIHARKIKETIYPRRLKPLSQAVFPSRNPDDLWPRSRVKWRVTFFNFEKWRFGSNSSSAERFLEPFRQGNGGQICSQTPPTICFYTGKRCLDWFGCPNLETSPTRSSENKSISCPHPSLRRWRNHWTSWAHVVRSTVGFHNCQASSETGHIWMAGRSALNLEWRSSNPMRTSPAQNATTINNFPNFPVKS